MREQAKVKTNQRIVSIYAMIDILVRTLCRLQGADLKRRKLSMLWK